MIVISFGDFTANSSSSWLFPTFRLSNVISGKVVLYYPCMCIYDESKCPTHRDTPNFWAAFKATIKNILSNPPISSLPMTLPSLSSLRYSGFTPGPIRSSQGIVSKSWGNIYKGSYTNPNPLIIMAFTTWPGLTFSPIQGLFLLLLWGLLFLVRCLNGLGFESPFFEALISQQNYPQLLLWFNHFFFCSNLIFQSLNFLFFYLSYKTLFSHSIAIFMILVLIKPFLPWRSFSSCVLLSVTVRVQLGCGRWV